MNKAPLFTRPWVNLFAFNFWDKRPPLEEVKLAVEALEGRWFECHREYKDHFQMMDLHWPLRWAFQYPQTLRDVIRYLIEESGHPLNVTSFGSFILPAVPNFEVYKLMTKHGAIVSYDLWPVAMFQRADFQWFDQFLQDSTSIEVGKREIDRMLTSIFIDCGILSYSGIPMMIVVASIYLMYPCTNDSQRLSLLYLDRIKRISTDSVPGLLRTVLQTGFLRLELSNYEADFESTPKLLKEACLDFFVREQTFVDALIVSGTLK
jgi:hypothetical protein